MGMWSTPQALSKPSVMSTASSFMPCVRPVGAAQAFAGQPQPVGVVDEPQTNDWGVHPIQLRSASWMFGWTIALRPLACDRAVRAPMSSVRVAAASSRWPP